MPDKVDAGLVQSCPGRVDAAPDKLGGFSFGEAFAAAKVTQHARGRCLERGFSINPRLLNGGIGELQQMGVDRGAVVIDNVAFLFANGSIITAFACGKGTTITNIKGVIFK
jgi:hypothetical protein